MAKFIIEPHFRLQEWIAEEKGYFRDEGLDYEFRELIRTRCLEPDAMRGQPFCMQQYNHLFHACRIPAMESSRTMPTWASMCRISGVRRLA